MQAILVVLLTVLGAALADQPVINTPPSVVQCLPSQVSFTGGTPPYFITVIPGGQPGAAPLQDFGQVTTSPLIWVVPQAAGTSVTLQIRDSEGQLNYSQQVTVQPGKTDCSASSTNTSSSAAATTSPSATTPVAGTNTSTATNTTSTSNDATSVNSTTITPAKTNTTSPAASTPSKGTSPFTSTSPATASTASSTPAAGAASAAPASFKLSASLIAIAAVAVTMVLSA